MDELITYSIEVSVCMILLFGLYVLALRKDTHFQFNRAYLLFSLIISLVLPVLNISIKSLNPVTGFSFILNTVHVGSETVMSTQNVMANARYIGIIYIAGIVFFSLIFSKRIFSLYLIRRNCRIEKKNGLFIAHSSKQISSFSFLNTIFIDQSAINDEQLDKIIVHETCHIQQLHSIDIIFSEIFCILTWYNPVSWFLKSAFKETHEYLADTGVTNQLQGFTEYFQLLTKNVVGVQPDLANNFNKSLTLKRMNMMKKTRSGRLSMLKALLVLPLLFLLFIIFSCKNKTDDLKSQFAASSQKSEKQANAVSLMPEYPGGQAAMTKFLIDNVKYPESAKKIGIQGTVYVAFIVTKTGKLDKIRARNSVNLLLETEAIRVVSSMPNWIPGENKGVPVDVELTLPINFKLSEK